MIVLIAIERLHAVNASTYYRKLHAAGQWPPERSVRRPPAIEIPTPREVPTSGIGAERLAICRRCQHLGSFQALPLCALIKEAIRRQYAMPKCHRRPINAAKVAAAIFGDYLAGCRPHPAPTDCRW